MSFHIEWRRSAVDSIALDETYYAHYKAYIVQLAVVSLCIEHVWSIIDLNTREIVKTGKHSMNIIATLGMGAAGEDIVDKVHQKVEEELRKLVDEEEIERILLLGE